MQQTVVLRKYFVRLPLSEGNIVTSRSGQKSLVCCFINVLDYTGVYARHHFGEPQVERPHCTVHIVFVGDQMWPVMYRRNSKSASSLYGHERDETCEPQRFLNL